MSLATGCKATFTRRTARTTAGGFALTEMIVAVGITALLALVICSLSMLSGRTFAAMFNYVDLDDVNRGAMDQLTSDLRQCNRVTDSTGTSITLEDSDGFTIGYNYSAGQRTLTRTKGGQARVLLRDCDTLAFSLGQRNAVGGSYDVYPAATAATAKVVNISWICSRTIFGKKENTESVQTARIVIRKQG